MTDMPTAADPSTLGFDPTRLQRIDDHFAEYVDDGRLAGWQVAVMRHGRLAHHSTYGKRDLESGADWAPDTIARMYSMSKPITSVAAMILHEEGRFQLKDPVSKFIPSFADTPVYRSGSFQAPLTEPQTEPMRIWHLLTHTSGLTYGFHNSHATDAMYRNDGFEWGIPAGLDLASCCDRWAALPLVFQPGSEWNYGVSTDVLGRVVEVVSGQPLDVFLQERVFEPLGMTDTAFWVPGDRRDRFAELYYRNPATKKAAKMPAPALTEKPDMLGGGGGLCGTAADYLRFTQMLMNGGELDGARILGSRTVDYMTTNHLPGDADLEEYGRPLFAETTFDGVGFGLGFSVVLDPAANKVPGSKGSYSWGGAASTVFWNDPAEEITALFLTQLLPSSTYPIRPQLQQLVYQALVD
ncbi:MAG: serine hydrolase domain-containing protein [Ilumatobacter sp.]|uniref:serine hydrolase domain-containing protein n=1 Tax=Ilumatobacter sp. TaxID=1967498 RepID=UPI00329A64B9